MLFNPVIVCCTLIAGGLMLLVVDDLELEEKHEDATNFPLAMYLKIGLVQCLAMVPGVSRSGSTIVGAMLLGASKRAAAEFSFFLAMPTMAGAFAYDLLKNYKTLTVDDTMLIVVGFIAAFVFGAARGAAASSTIVSKRGFALFAWWRIIVGMVGLAGLWIVG